jgi:hypothetical protein
MRGNTAGPSADADTAEPAKGANGRNGATKHEAAGMTDEPPASPAKLHGLERARPARSAAG